MVTLKTYKYFIIAGLTMAGLSACSDSGNSPIEEESTVQIPDSSVLPSYRVAVMLEGSTLKGRSEDSKDNTFTGVIGRGELIDMLIYAVYDKEGKLLSNFAKEEVSKLETSSGIINAGEGQNILSWDGEVIYIEFNNIALGEYKLVAWAQNSGCKAYNTSDLSNVTVSYENALNNDETRDAFCGELQFTVSPVSASEQENLLILRRPFAQINVGTTGADYANNILVPGGALYTHSSITVTGVSNIINVVDNVIGNPIDEEVTFGYNKLAAFYNMEIPEQSDDLIKSDDEIFLQIHLNDSPLNDKDGDNFADYLINYPTVLYNSDRNAITSYLTETFKYMSMCYVLVPSVNEGSTTLDKLKVSFADNEEANGIKTSFKLNTIPVGRNIRTNIIGGLYAPEVDSDSPGWPENPTDPTPDDPNYPNEPEEPEEPVDDPTTIFSSINCEVTIITSYFGNTNLDNSGNTLGK